MRNKKNATLIAVIVFAFMNINAQSQYGSQSCAFNSSLIDPNYQDEMEKWATAGVPGGIPLRGTLLVKVTVKPKKGDMTSEINSALVDVANSGGGVVLLTEGNYTITELFMQSGVVLRGAGRDETKLNCEAISGEDEYDMRYAVWFERNVTGAGVEDLTIEWTTRDGSNLEKCRKIINSKPSYGAFVGLINIFGDGNWVDNLALLNSGSDPLQIGDKVDFNTKHNTVRNTFIENCHNKGGGGNGYFDLKGSYNLITGCTIRYLRHFAFQFSLCEYNVIIKNHFYEVDINPHQNDGGHNLFEQNTGEADCHGWGMFSAGASFHEPPGEKNFIFNNEFLENGEPIASGDDKIFTWEGKGDPVSTIWTLPKHGTFYPVSCGSGPNNPTK